MLTRSVLARRMALRTAVMNLSDRSMNIYRPTCRIPPAPAAPISIGSISLSHAISRRLSFNDLCLSASRILSFEMSKYSVLCRTPPFDAVSVSTARNWMCSYFEIGSPGLSGFNRSLTCRLMDLMQSIPVPPRPMSTVAVFSTWSA